MKLGFEGWDYVTGPGRPGRVESQHLAWFPLARRVSGRGGLVSNGGGDGGGARWAWVSPRWDVDAEELVGDLIGEICLYFIVCSRLSYLGLC